MSGRRSRLVGAKISCYSQISLLVDSLIQKKPAEDSLADCSYRQIVGQRNRFCRDYVAPWLLILKVILPLCSHLCNNFING